MPSLNIRSLPFVVFLGGFPSRCQNLSSGAIRPGGLLFILFRKTDPVLWGHGDWKHKTKYGHPYMYN